MNAGKVQCQREVGGQGRKNEQFSEIFSIRKKIGDEVHYVRDAQRDKR